MTIFNLKILDNSAIYKYVYIYPKYLLYSDIIHLLGYNIGSFDLGYVKHILMSYNFSFITSTVAKNNFKKGVIFAQKIYYEMSSIYLDLRYLKENLFHVLMYKM